MKTFIKTALYTILATVALFQYGCGYHMGSLMHPQVKSIAIAPVKNDTLEPFMSSDMRGALCEQFQFDNSLSVKQLGESDCILYGRIVDIKTKGKAYDTYNDKQDYVPSEWRVTVTFEFVVMIPGRKQPLITKRRVEGTAKFQVMTDQAITRRRGVQYACIDAAKKAVIYTTEAW